MAIAQLQVQLLLALRRNGFIGPGKSRSILELGEQNWYGDIEAREIGDLIDVFAASTEQAASLRQALQQQLDQPDEWSSFRHAKLFYQLAFGHERYQAIDLHGSPGMALAHDLNLPLPLQEQFDVVTNLGTAEHVFNQYQVFRSIHERCRPGGLMLHALPNQGAYDHGFFNYHPTFLFDLCEANGYGAVLIGYADCSKALHRLHELRSREDYVRMAVDGRLSAQSGLLAVLRKPAGELPFAVPRQGYYDNRLPEALAEAWRKLNR